MSDGTGSVGAGWMHAEGDPPGTERYWNGSQWEGEPRPVVASHAAPTPAPPGAMYTPPAFNSPPPAAPAKKRSAWKWLLGILFVIVLGIGGCTYVFWRAVSGPIDLGNEFLNAVQAEDYQRAWGLADASCFDEGGPDMLAAAFEGTVIDSYDLVSSNASVNNGVSTGTTSGTVTFSGGDVRAIEIFASRPGGDWRVCGFDISAPGGG